MNTGGPLLELRHVTFGYGREAVVEDVSFAIGPTDFIALLGPNGGGKTTLVKLMLGLLRPWSGEILRRLPPGRGTVGYVPQFSTFERGFPLRVADVVLMGRLGRRGLFRPYRREDREQVHRTLDRLGLGRLARTHVSELSGGQLQRVLIARALAGEPAILLMDEPTASVDAESRASLGDLLAELAGRIPVLVVTHNEAGIGRQVTRTLVVDRRLISQDAAGAGHSHHPHPAGDSCG